MKLSLVVPCYNEELNVRKFYDCVIEAFKNIKYSFEIIFVDDGSKDNTLKELKKLYNESKINIKIISFSRNFGKEAAVLAGLKHSKGEFVSIIDADLQQRPEVVITMVNILDNNLEYDCVAAYQEHRREGKILSFFKKMFYKTINRVCEIEFYNGASDFRTFRRKMVNAIIDMPEYFRFSKGIFSWVGFNTHYIPYTVEQRHSGESKWSFIKLVKYAIEGFISFTVFPLKISTYLGIFTSILAIIYLIVVIIQKIVYSIDIPGYPTIISLILLLGGIQLIILGIIGEYISKIYIEGKKRPIYIEKEFIESLEDLNEKNSSKVIY